MDQRGAAFGAFVAEHEQHLRGTALLLTGDPAAADDLLVAALARTHRRWRRLDAPATAVAETRSALVTATLGRTRLPEPGAASAVVAELDEDGPVAGADARWLQALGELDPMTRAVAVLRLHDGQAEDDVAALLRLSPGDVSAALADALDVLGPLLDDDPDEPGGSPPAPLEEVAPAPPVTPAPGGAAEFADPYGIYRRSAPPPPRPAPCAPDVVPHAPPVNGHPDDDPDAIYRRPT
ncbi:hypothetical protein [Modestobacter italicus]|uniref:hypothetical protein n=1 Tax=Modestobacter italicus (strain DSM 44449 / CECT 9708 / BC 501) TaxID=2732864 RepID=UPI001C9864BC|nr:hypothetical protein [Modestobacter italicus]